MRRLVLLAKLYTCTSDAYNHLFILLSRDEVMDDISEKGFKKIAETLKEIGILAVTWNHDKIRASDVAVPSKTLYEAFQQCGIKQSCMRITPAVGTLTPTTAVDPSLTASATIRGGGGATAVVYAGGVQLPSSIFARAAQEGTKAIFLLQTKDDLERFWQRKTYRVVMQSADWCKYSRDMAPVFAACAPAIGDTKVSFGVIGREMLELLHAQLIASGDPGLSVKEDGSLDEKRIGYPTTYVITPIGQMLTQWAGFHSAYNFRSRMAAIFDNVVVASSTNPSKQG